MFTVDVEYYEGDEYFYVVNAYGDTVDGPYGTYTEAAEAAEDLREF